MHVSLLWFALNRLVYLSILLLYSSIKACLYICDAFISASIRYNLCLGIMYHIELNPKSVHCFQQHIDQNGHAMHWSKLVRFRFCGCAGMCSLCPVLKIVSKKYINFFKPIRSAVQIMHAHFGKENNVEKLLQILLCVLPMRAQLNFLGGWMKFLATVIRCIVSSFVNMPFKCSSNRINEDIRMIKSL